MLSNGHISQEKKTKVLNKNSGFGYGDSQFKVYVLSDGERVTDYEYTIKNSIGSSSKDEDGALVLQATKSGDATIIITYGEETASFRWHRD